MISCSSLLNSPCSSYQVQKRREPVMALLFRQASLPISNKLLIDLLPSYASSDWPARLEFRLGMAPAGGGTLAENHDSDGPKKNFKV